MMRILPADHDGGGGDGDSDHGTRHRTEQEKMFAHAIKTGKRSAGACRQHRQKSIERAPCVPTTGNKQGRTLAILMRPPITPTRMVLPRRRIFSLDDIVLGHVKSHWGPRSPRATVSWTCLCPFPLVWRSSSSSFVGRYRERSP